MAKQEGLFKFSGRLGDKVGFRGKNGSHFLRTFRPIPADTWHNDPKYQPNRIAAHNFGSDSSLSKYIRMGLAEYLDLMADARLHNRLMRQIGQARKFCMRDDPKAALDMRKIAPAFKHFSLRADMSMGEVTAQKPTWKMDHAQGRILQIPALHHYGHLWKKANAEYLRWHVVALPFVDAHTDPSPWQVQKSESAWMPIDHQQAIEVPITAAAAEHPPMLIALGIEVAQGDGIHCFPLRSLSVMEILEII